MNQTVETGINKVDYGLTVNLQSSSAKFCCSHGFPQEFWIIFRGLCNYFMTSEVLRLVKLKYNEVECHYFL